MTFKEHYYLEEKKKRKKKKKRSKKQFYGYPFWGPGWYGYDIGNTGGVDTGGGSE